MQAALFSTTSTSKASPSIGSDLDPWGAFKAPVAAGDFPSTAASSKGSDDGESKGEEADAKAVASQPPMTMLSQARTLFVVPLMLPVFDSLSIDLLLSLCHCVTVSLCLSCVDAFVCVCVSCC